MMSSTTSSRSLTDDIDLVNVSFLLEERKREMAGKKLQIG